MIETHKEKTQEETKVVCVISFQQHCMCKLKNITQYQMQTNTKIHL